MKTKENNKIIIKGWAHRDANGDLFIADYPDVKKIEAYGGWKCDFDKGNWWQFPEDLLPEVKWEDEKPTPVTLTVTVGYTDTDADEAKPTRRIVLHPFDKVLVRDSHTGEWLPAHFNFIDDSYRLKFACETGRWKYCIPYSKDTAHLIGTTDEPNIDYDIHFDPMPRED